VQKVNEALVAFKAIIEKPSGEYSFATRDIAYNVALQHRESSNIVNEFVKKLKGE